MPAPGLSAAVARLGRSVCPAEEPADGRLLGRFVAARDPAAFAELVARHGPMVFAVCRKLTGHHQDAEDAFQAAFVVLARRAADVKPREAVGNWLYGVAVRVAREARAAAARRRGREVPTAVLPEPARAAYPPEPDDLGAVLHEELAALPDKFRTLLVLCDLEGRPQTAVAGRLGLPVGTVYSRLAAARQALAARLRRRGVAPTAAALTGLLAEAGRAAVPPGLAARAGAAVVSPGTVPAAVAALSNGVIRTMLVPKLLLAAGGLLVAVVAGGLLAADPPTPADPAPPTPAAAANAADPKLKAAPPVVVKTVPQAGADDVDPALTEVKVTFSKPMADGSWSWSTAPEEYGEFPKVEGGKPAYDKGLRTCTLPVKLQPGTTYAIWVNSDRFRNFQDADGRPAVPYLLTFRTKAK
jgi:RNA polymerase sigma-70 factor (ECF subfamily)